MCCRADGAPYFERSHDAEDAVQNAFLEVIHHFDEISEIPCKKLGFWIISIVKNEALMILRRKQKSCRKRIGILFSADVSDPTSYNELVQLFSQLPHLPCGAGNAADQRLLRQGNCTASWDLESAVNTRISAAARCSREIAVKEGFPHMTEQELDLFMRNVLLDAIALDEERIQETIPYTPSLHHQKQIKAMLKNPLRWARSKAACLEKSLKRVAVILLVISLAFR